MKRTAENRKSRVESNGRRAVPSDSSTLRLFDSSIPAYLDSVCQRLRSEPAEAEDIREELHAHLEELTRLYVSQGAAPAEALGRALAQFGEPAKIGDTLDLVHEGDAWWLRRLKGLMLGLALGALLSAVLPVGGHLDFALSRFPLPGALALPRAEMVLNAALAGGLIGACSARGKGLLIGWSLGAVLWLAEFVASWLWRAGGGAAEPATASFPRPYWRRPLASAHPSNNVSWRTPRPPGASYRSRYISY